MAVTEHSQRETLVAVTRAQPERDTSGGDESTAREILMAVTIAQPRERETGSPSVEQNDY